KAEAEHGGFYQAIATGIYRRHGLDVTLRMGGPQVNNPQLLAAGVVDFNVGASSFAALNYVKAGVPVVTVAAIFQKDPQVLIAHPGQGNDTLEALKGKPILIAPSARHVLEFPARPLRLYRRSDPHLHLQHGPLSGRPESHSGRLSDE
ncbi:MAG TPA: ABC transporter substrate-binding protein, partial [Thermoanaerobaculia bacterium]